MKTLQTVITILLIVFVWSCSKDKHQTKNIGFKKIPVYRLCNTTSNNEKQHLYVVNDLEEYRRLTNCLIDPVEIDFTKDFIITGWAAFNNCSNLKSESIKIDKDILHYNLSVEEGECPKLDTIFVMAALPIAYKDKQVLFSVNN